MANKNIEDELKSLEPRLILVPARIVHRVIQNQKRISTFLTWIPGSTPKATSVWTNSETIGSLAAELEFNLETDHLPFGKVLLLAKPDSESMDRPEDIRTYYWRALFQAEVRLKVLEKMEAGSLGPEEIRSRIEAIEQHIFDEAIMVLDQDQKAKTSDPIEFQYMEFCASFLDLFYFAENLIGNTFPSIRSPSSILDVLRKDIADISLFQSTRPNNAPFPEPAPETHSEESREFFRKLCLMAEKESRLGKPALAAILWTQANRVAPAEHSKNILDKSHLEIRALVRRLQTALDFSPQEEEDWTRALIPLLDKADQGFRPVEERLLNELQLACEDFEQEIYSLDPIGWIFSLGKKPLKKPLPHQRSIRIYHRLRDAGLKSITTRIGFSERKKLETILVDAAKKSESILRELLRPIVNKNLKDAGFEAVGTLGTLANQRLVEEFLDELLDQGYLSYSELRDLISRNFLKMEDINDPKVFFDGDALLRLDRHLSHDLEGVYLGSDFYQRWLEKFTALNFGTYLGRQLTRYITLPLGSAFLLVEALDLLLLKTSGGALSQSTNKGLIAIIAVIVFSLVNYPALRMAVGNLFLQIWNLIWLFCFDIPGKVISWKPFQLVWNSLPFQIMLSLVLKPLLFTEAIMIWLPRENRGPLLEIALFLGFTLLLNSRPGRMLAEIIRLAFSESLRLIKEGLFTILFQMSIRAFKQIITWLEVAIHWINNWLRLRGPHSSWNVALRATLGIIWAPIALFLRFYTVVLIEPGINPIKFPISSIAAKFVYPIVLPMTAQLVGWSSNILGEFFANLFISTTIFFLPDMFGFLVWETKENWGLFRANRSRALQPVSVGPHGETICELLKPGFHSGTIPKLFQKLRVAEQEAVITNDWRKSRTLRQELKEIRDKVLRFLERDFLAPLKQQDHDFLNLRISDISIGLNRIQAELIGLSNQGYSSMTISIELNHGWIVGGIHIPGGGFYPDDENRKRLELSLAGLYKFAGVQFSREQVVNSLPSWVRHWKITTDGIQFMDQGNHPLFVNTVNEKPLLEVIKNSERFGPLPQMDGNRLLFSRMVLTWKEWSDRWESAHQHKELAPLYFSGIEPDLLGLCPNPQIPDPDQKLEGAIQERHPPQSWEKPIL